MKRIFYMPGHVEESEDTRLNVPYSVFGWPDYYKDVIVAGVRVTLWAPSLQMQARINKVDTVVSANWQLPRQRPIPTGQPYPKVAGDLESQYPNDERLIKQKKSKKIKRTSGPDKPLHKKWSEIENARAIRASFMGYGTKVPLDPKALKARREQ